YETTSPPLYPCRSPARRRRRQTAPRLLRYRRDHELHQYLESVGDDRRGPRRKESRGKGPQAAAVGEDEPRAWLEGGDGLPAAGRPHAVSRAAAVPFGGLRLHHLHRQLGAPP